MVVDVHTHVVPDEYVALVREGAGPPGASVRESADGPPVVVSAGGRSFPHLAVFHDPRAKLAEMDADGIDVALVSPNAPLFLYSHEASETARIHRVVNDGAARFASGGEGRLHALATVPLNDPAAAAQELRRAREDLDMVGAIIGTSIDGVALDAAELDPFYATAQELAMPLVLHPHLTMGGGLEEAPQSGLDGFHLGNAVGNPLETHIAAARLIVGGVLDRHPGLTVQLVHGGGGLPYQLGRLEHAYRVREDTKAVARRRPGAYLERFLFDTVLFDERALDLLLGVAGAERVVFGTDRPFDMADVSALRWVRDLGSDVAEAVASGNAARAYGLPGC